MSRSSAIDAALAVIDAECLDAPSLPRLARELGLRAPSLYYHFSDRSEILGRTHPPMRNTLRSFVDQSNSDAKRSLVQDRGGELPSLDQID